MSNTLHVRSAISKWLVAAVIGCLVFAVSACTTSSGPSGADLPALETDVESDVSAGVAIGIRSNNASPASGDVVDLTIELTAAEVMDNARLEVDLPAGLSLQGNAPGWTGNLKPGDTTLIDLAVEVERWPPAEPIRITVTNDIATYTQQWPAPESTSGLRTVEVSAGARVTLQADPADPDVGEPVTLTGVITADADFALVTADLELPASFELLNGETAWTGALTAGVPQTLIVEGRLTAPLTADPLLRVDLGNGETHRQAANLVDRPAVELEMPPVIESPIEAEGPLPGEPTPEIVDAPAPGGDRVPEEALPAAGISSSETLHPDGRIDISAFVLPFEDLPGVVIAVELPDHFVVDQGETRWEGNIPLGTSQRLDLALSRTAPDEGTITFVITSGAFDTRYDVWIPSMEALNQPEGSAADEIAAAAAPQGSNTYKGRFVYKEDGSNAKLRGAYYSRVQVFDSDGALNPDDHICNATTNGSGSWQCSGSASDGIFDDTIEPYAKLVAINSNYAQVQNGSGTVYAVQTSQKNADEDGGQTIDFGTQVPIANNHQAPWHILKMGIYGHITSQNLGGENPPNSSSSKFAKFVWPASGSFYSSYLIRVAGGSGDVDEWDESVILHEYGHYLMDVLASLDPPSVSYCNSPGETPPCGHSFNSFETQQTAYIEGWANFFQSAVKYYYGMPNPAVYEETTWSFNIENSWHPVDGSNWDRVESSVAGIMLDIMDTPNDDQNSDGVGDIVNSTYNSVHNIFSSYNPAGSPTHPWTVHHFYTGYQANNSIDDAVRRIYWEHGIDKDARPNVPILIKPAHQALNQSVTPLLDWSASDPDGDSLTYKVYLEPNDATPDNVQASCPTSYSFCYPQPLLYNTYYYWKIEAQDIYGKKRTSATYWFKTRKIPGVIGLAASQNFDHMVKLTWSGVPYADSYKVKRVPASGRGPAVTFIVRSNSFTDWNVQGGIAYRYSVRACQAGECGTDSRPVIGKRKAMVYLPFVNR